MSLNNNGNNEQPKFSQTAFDQRDNSMWSRHQGNFDSNDQQHRRHMTLEALRMEADGFMGMFVRSLQWIGEQRLIQTNVSSAFCEQQQKVSKLPYAVIKRFPDFQFDGMTYRFDQIGYQGRQYLRLIKDEIKSASNLARLNAELLDGLVVEEVGPSLVEELTKIFTDISKDNLTKTLDMIATIKKGKTSEPETPLQEEKKEELKPGAQRHTHAFDAAINAGFNRNTEPTHITPPESVLTNPFVIKMLSMEHAVHLHGSLGLLLAL